MKNKALYLIFNWLVRVIGYALILITATVIFKNTIYIDNQYYGFWAIIASIIISILNIVIKPILIWLTLPITALTLGLFYPVINVILLNMVDIILKDHFKIQGLFMSIVVAITISLMNILLNNLIINQFIGGKNE